MKNQVLKYFLKPFKLQLKRGKREAISTKSSYSRTIVPSLASRNSNGLSFSLTKIRNWLNIRVSSQNILK